MRRKDGWPRFETNIRYSEHSELNTYQVCLVHPPDSSDVAAHLWVVYIHGGAWFDAEQDASTFDLAQNLLLQSSAAKSIAGFASINYRLSPPPPDSSLEPDPTSPARNAKHPDHIGDVLAAIAHLQSTYEFSRYILVGHSCGAMLAMQVAMNRTWTDHGDKPSTRHEILPPLAICGIEGLYDLPALVQYHEQQAMYRDFVTNAFGSDENMWKVVSPTACDLLNSWGSGRLVVIAHSRADELVEWEQPSLMLECLRQQKFDESEGRQIQLLELTGTHDSVWKQGTEVAHVIEWTVNNI